MTEAQPPLENSESHEGTDEGQPVSERGSVLPERAPGESQYTRLTERRSVRRAMAQELRRDADDIDATPYHMWKMRDRVNGEWEWRPFTEAEIEEARTENDIRAAICRQRADDLEQGSSPWVSPRAGTDPA